MSERADAIGKDRATTIILLVVSLILIPFLAGIGWGAGFGFGEAVYDLGWYETADPFAWLDGIVRNFMLGAVFIPGIVILVADGFAIAALVQEKSGTRYPLWGMGIGLAILAVFVVVSSVLEAVS